MSTAKYWIWLAGRKGLGGLGVNRILDHFGTPEAAFFADPEEYNLLEGLPAGASESLKDKSLDRAEQVLADCDRLLLQVLTRQDADYPNRLRQLPDAPAVLYIKGKLPRFDDEVAVAVVGSRGATEYGVGTAARFGLELTRRGALVISGIAQGIDTAALKGALQAGGPVVSVLGGGVDVPYPRENRFLYEDVAAAGALISEYPPGTENKGAHFPVRNRIISGLALGVLAVEAEEHSGTMITAHLAADQGRDVFAVPGPIDAPMSRGTNLLIQEGAQLVRDPGDILRCYEMYWPGRLRRGAPLPLECAQARVEEAVRAIPREEPPRQEKIDTKEKRAYISMREQPELFTDDERAILTAAAEGELTADEIIDRTQIPARRVLSALTMLQLNGYVEERPGRRFRALVLLKD